MAEFFILPESCAVAYRAWHRFPFKYNVFVSLRIPHFCSIIIYANVWLLVLVSILTFTLCILDQVMIWLKL